MERFESFKREVLAFKLPTLREFPDVGLYMDQVVSLTEKYLKVFKEDGDKGFITPSMINNYVKLGVMPPPENKRYNQTHLAYLIMICALKQALSINEIKLLLSFDKSTLEREYERFCAIVERSAKTLAVDDQNDVLELAMASVFCKLYAKKLIELKD